jgi:TonB family protein
MDLRSCEKSKPIGSETSVRLTLLILERDFLLMRVYPGVLVGVCGGVVLASSPLAHAQEATSANLPEHLELGEATPAPKLKKKKMERSREVAARTPSQTPAPVTEETPSLEPTTPAVPVQKKAHVKRRVASAVSPAAAIFPTVTQLSLSAAQGMAVSAPLPEYPYQAKHANVTGSGICVMTVDTASGKVTTAMMAQSTGNAILDKVTTETFRRWRFKPGSVSQVRVPISYE